LKKAKQCSIKELGLKVNDISDYWQVKMHKFLGKMFKLLKLGKLKQNNHAIATNNTLSYQIQFLFNNTSASSVESHP